MFGFKTQNHKKFLRSNKKMRKIPLLPPPFPPLIPKGRRKKNPKSCPKERGGVGWGQGRRKGVMEKEELMRNLWSKKERKLLVGWVIDFSFACWLHVEPAMPPPSLFFFCGSCASQIPLSLSHTHTNAYSCRLHSHSLPCNF